MQRAPQRVSRFLWVALVIGLGDSGLGGGGWAQQREWKPPVEGVPTDPTAWDRWVERYYQIVKVKKGLEVRLGQNLAYPDPRVKALMEIVAEDDEYVYLRNLPLEDPRSAGHRGWVARQLYESRLLFGEEFYKDKFVLWADEFPVPPITTQRLSWASWSEGLPSAGLWQMGFDVADVNGDGFLDLVFPPARKGDPHPAIFLQRGEKWEYWQTAAWPADVPFDYGDVKVADFDGDEKLDIAIACHFRDTYILFGDGKGNFQRYSKLPRTSASATYRSLAVADFNGDKRPDIARLAELDVEIGTGKKIGSGLLSVLLNEGASFKELPVEGADQVFGDQMAVGDFNGDGYLDLVVASHKANNDAYIFLNEKGQGFTPYRHLALPFRAYVFAVGAARLDGEKPDQVLLGIAQSVRREQKPYSFVHAMLAYRIADAKGRILQAPQREVLFKEDFRETDLFRSLAVADVDEDGRKDVIAARADSGLMVLLQNPDGRWVVDTSVPKLELGSPNAVRCVDLDGDRKPELVVNFSDAQGGLGGIRVFRLARAVFRKAAR